jgi:hypothetical protein
MRIVAKTTCRTFVIIVADVRDAAIEIASPPE